MIYPHYFAFNSFRDCNLSANAKCNDIIKLLNFKYSKKNAIRLDDAQHGCALHLQPENALAFAYLDDLLIIDQSTSFISGPNIPSPEARLDDVYMAIRNQRALTTLEADGELVGQYHSANDLGLLFRGQIGLGIVDILGNHAECPQSPLPGIEVSTACDYAVGRIIIRPNSVVLHDKAPELSIGPEQETLNEELVAQHFIPILVIELARHLPELFLIGTNHIRSRNHILGENVHVVVLLINCIGVRLAGSYPSVLPFCSDQEWLSHSDRLEVVNN